jgi:hypothetical protein
MVGLMCKRTLDVQESHKHATGNEKALKMRGVLLSRPTNTFLVHTIAAAWLQ